MCVRERGSAQSGDVAGVSAGDVDGDGRDDLLIGASGNDDAGSNAGKVYLVIGASLEEGTRSLADSD